MEYYNRKHMLVLVDKLYGVIIFPQMYDEQSEICENYIYSLQLSFLFCPQLIEAATEYTLGSVAQQLYHRLMSKIMKQ